MTIEKARVLKQIQKDIISYIDGKAFLHHDQFRDDLCRIVADNFKVFIEKQKKDLTLGN